MEDKGLEFERRPAVAFKGEGERSEARSGVGCRAPGRCSPATWCPLARGEEGEKGEKNELEEDGGAARPQRRTFECGPSVRPAPELGLLCARWPGGARPWCPWPGASTPVRGMVHGRDEGRELHERLP